MSRPLTGAFSSRPSNPPASPGLSVKALVEHHETWIADTFLPLPLKAKNAAWGRAWRVLGARKAIPTHHEVLDALRVASLTERDQSREQHADHLPFVPFDDSDED